VLVGQNGARLPVMLVPGVPRDFTVPGARPYPLDDLAAGRTTFPTSPLPAGMSDPATAVDDDPLTAWRPGPSGRMVVDLGAAQRIGPISLKWTFGPVPTSTITTSVDGRVYTAPAATARYVAVSTGWRQGQASLTSISVRRPVA
jgi:hypothetical protein